VAVICVSDVRLLVCAEIWSITKAKRNVHELLTHQIYAYAYAGCFRKSARNKKGKRNYYSNRSRHFIRLAPSSGKRNVTVWGPSFRLTIPFLILPLLYHSLPPAALYVITSLFLPNCLLTLHHFLLQLSTPFAGLTLYRHWLFSHRYKILSTNITSSQICRFSSDRLQYYSVCASPNPTLGSPLS